MKKMTLALWLLPVLAGISALAYGHCLECPGDPNCGPGGHCTVDVQMVEDQVTSISCDGDVVHNLYETWRCTDDFGYKTFCQENESYHCGNKHPCGLVDVTPQELMSHMYDVTFWMDHCGAVTNQSTAVSGRAVNCY